jgi:5-methylcytosine-specific restriction protein B
MARAISKRDLGPILAAASTWVETCWVKDGSLFSAEALWTPALIEEVRTAFVDNPDEGGGDFMSKLKGQMAGASAAAQRLMAEMQYALLLFPSNVGPETKRRQVNEIWSLAGDVLPADHPLLADAALVGVGSGGPGFNNHRWREVVFIISLSVAIKRLEPGERQRVLHDYDAYMDWVDTVSRDGFRQFRHMLRYFLFPDRVERMSSNGERWSVLEGFEVEKGAKLRKWTDRQLDDALLALRRRMEREHPGQLLDFYEPPLDSVWRSPEQPEPLDPEPRPVDVLPPVAIQVAPNRDESSFAAVNLILYGPPGTGKTHWLRNELRRYTDAPRDIDRDAWLQSTLAAFGWRCVLVAALADLKGPKRVPDLRIHPWVVAKFKERGRTGNSSQTIWGTLQQHTPESVASVKTASRRPPFVFTKRETGEWELLTDWADQDSEAVDLLRLLRNGPTQTGEIHRYKLVTFHPSFSYEDFIRGIRPVSTGEDGVTQFRLVDGKFKQICDEARANPGKRYAIFIDEINRANIAKVFGELITLIEVDKRAVYDADGGLIGGMAVNLPGGDTADTSEPPFGVPSNLDIYGTMNTADRSIALLDVALRRRFQFRELEPDYSTLVANVGAVDRGRLLRRINDRLEYLLDRDHRIGHGYLFHVRTLDDLRRVFAEQIIPLLQEYFFDDFARVAMVLSTEGPKFLAPERLEFSRLFPGRPDDGASSSRDRYLLTPRETWTEDSFIGIYGESEAMVSAQLLS